MDACASRRHSCAGLIRYKQGCPEGRKAGVSSLRAIAGVLNARGIRSRSWWGTGWLRPLGIPIQAGIPPEEAIRTVRSAREGAIETLEQEKWVKAAYTSKLFEPVRDIRAIRDRAIGALLGLAVGDAVGTTLEFRFGRWRSL
jgi:hypothetical protein